MNVMRMNGTVKVITTIAVMTVITLAVALAQPMTANVYAETWQVVAVQVNSETVEMVSGQPAVIKDGATLVPVRDVMEKLNFEIDWNGNTNTATLTKDGYLVSITLGMETMKVNEHVVPLSTQAQLINERTMLPLRAVAEATGATVNWDADNLTAIIDTNDGEVVAVFMPMMDEPLAVVMGFDVSTLPQYTSDVFDAGFGGVSGIEFGFSTASSYGSGYQGLTSDTFTKGDQKYANYEIKWDLAPTDLRYNYSIWDGEGASTNRLANHTNFHPLNDPADPSKGPSANFYINTNTAPRTSNGELVSNGFAKGQTIKIKVTLRNTTNGETASWGMEFTYPGDEGNRPNIIRPEAVTITRTE